MKTNTRHPRLRGAVAALLLPLALGACEGLLDVKNPAVIEEDQLASREMVEVMAHGIAAQFQRTFGTQALYTGILSDELIDTHVYLPHNPWDRREIDARHEFVRGQYAAVHALRGVADTLGARMESLLGQEAGSSLAMAKARAYAGFGLVLLGDNFCSSPVDGGPALSSDELYAEAIERFDAAISIAQAARTAGADAEEADRFLNFARVGAARAALGAGLVAEAVAYAEQVPADFEFMVAYSDNSGGEDNPFYSTTTSYEPDAYTSRWIGLGTSFEGLNDLRIPHTAEPIEVYSDKILYVPYQPSTFSEWVPGDRVPLSRTAYIQAASGLEARYIVQEIQGPTLEFLNERRAAGGQAPLLVMPADPLAELRDQRRRDLFLSGHRWGDLRRYKARYGVDLYPRGAYEQSTTDEVYGTAECIPVSQNELDSNPNL